jgi:hypothetical protein
VQWQKDLYGAVQYGFSLEYVPDGGYIIGGIKDGNFSLARIAADLPPVFETVAAPEASRPAGEVEAGTQITLSSATEGASIFYTINGTTPTVNSIPYTGVITINTDSIIKVIALKAGMNPSAVVTLEYTVSQNPGDPDPGTIDKCFIATAAFGSKFEPAVVLLRKFRDEFLLTNVPGTRFVDFYYRTSPPIARYIAGNETLKLTVRVLLLPLIAVVWLLYHPGLFTMLGLGLVLLGVFRRRQRLSSAPRN